MSKLQIALLALAVLVLALGGWLVRAARWPSHALVPSTH
jgi:formate hydrogenlyase subunit 3/multisubunit Na+/H+ antiporter MnhD subunit